MDDGSAFLGTKGDPNFPQDSRNMAAQWGRQVSTSGTASRRRSSTSCRAGNVVTRNTEVRGIITLQSGQPFTPLLRFDNSNTGNTGSRAAPTPEPGGRSRRRPIRPPTQWFNTERLRRAAAVHLRRMPGATSCAGRVCVRGPGGGPPHPAPRGARTWVDAQVIQLFNRVNYDLPELYVDEPATFGRIFSAKAPRQVQFAVRVNF